MRIALHIAAVASAPHWGSATSAAGAVGRVQVEDAAEDGVLGPSSRASRPSPE